VILLLDTHLLLWAAAGSPRLSSKAAELILDENNRLLFSAASIWEVAIKSGPNRPDFKVSASRFRRGRFDNGYRPGARHSRASPTSCEKSVGVSS